MDEDKKVISYDDALKLLPIGNQIHTFRQAGPALLGADHSRTTLLDELRKADEIMLTGPAARAMNHGLAIFDDHGVLFIATAIDAEMAKQAEKPAGNA